MTLTASSAFRSSRLVSLSVVWNGIAVAFGLVVASSGTSMSQALPLPVGASDSATVALIEAEGAAFPKASSIPAYPNDFLKGWIENQDRFGPPPKEIGRADRRCVPVPPEGVVRRWDNRIWVPTAFMRSGDFRVAGGRPMLAGRGQKLPWTPAWPSPSMELVIRARRLSEPAETFRITYTDVLHESTAESASQPWQASFPTRIVFPSAGTWVVVGTSGLNWGCLIYRVTNE